MIKSVFEKSAAVFISLCIIFCAFPVFASAQINNSVTYSFLNDDSGSAGGTVTVFSDTVEGEIKLYWGNRGAKLEGYSCLAYANIEKSEELNIEIQSFTTIPVGAKQLLVYKNESYVTGLVYNLPAGKITDYGEKLYSFGVVSDVHIPTNEGRDLDNALKKFQEYGCSFVGIPGDIASDGTAEQLAVYQSIISKYSDSLPVYVAAGNHDARSGGLDTTQWKKYTGCDRQFVVKQGNDVFLFMGLKYWPQDSNGRQVFSESQLDWLEAQLEENKNANVYLFEHVFFPEYCGDVFDEYGTPVYGEWFVESDPLTVRFRNALMKYNNVTWFNGHSHWKFYLQNNNPNLNIFGGDNYCNMVHVPSVTIPRDYIKGIRTDDESASEGYIVDVYENATVLQGYDFMENQIDSFADYVVTRNFDTTPRVVDLDIDKDFIKTNAGTTVQLNISTISRYDADESYTWTFDNDCAGKLKFDENGVISIYRGAPLGEYTLTIASKTSPEITDSIRIIVTDEDGSREHPYIIKSAQDFIDMSEEIERGNNYSGKYIKQMCDIDLTGTGFNGCTYTDEFLGTYDGNGYKIKAEIAHSTRNTLFGYVGNDTERGVLMNICADINVSNSNYCAGLAYSIRRYGMAINCYSVSSVKASERAGGLFCSVYGYAYNCFASATLNGNPKGGVAAQWYSSDSRLKYNYYLDSNGAGSSASSDELCLKKMTSTQISSTDFLAELNLNIESSDSFITASGYSGISSADLVKWKAGENTPQFASLEDKNTITEITVGGVEASIDGNIIKIKAPNNIDLKAVKPHFKFDGNKALIENNPTSFDFSKDGEITVVAENGLKKIYTVKIELYSVITPGDVDNDGNVTVSDVVLLRRLIMSNSYTNEQLLAGDLDENNILSVSDVVTLRKLIMNG